MWRGCQLAVYCFSAPKGPACDTDNSSWPAGPKLSFANWGHRRDTEEGREFSHSFCCAPLPTGSCGARLSGRAPCGRSTSGAAVLQVPQHCSCLQASIPHGHLSWVPQGPLPPAPTLHDVQSPTSAPCSFPMSWTASSHSLLCLQQLPRESHQLPGESNGPQPHGLPTEFHWCLREVLQLPASDHWQW